MSLIAVGHLVGAAVSAEAKRSFGSPNEGDKLTVVRRIDVYIEVETAAYDDDRP
jgi:hypothetical protein